MINQQQYEEAIRNIEAGMFWDGFLLLTKCYESADTSERNSIMEILRNVFYLPNFESLRENYENNSIILKEYPYWFGPEIPGFDELDMLAFPVDNKIFFLYNKAKGDFVGIEVNSDKETKYFFKDLSKPLLIEEESNEFNLHFLADNVRASEDVAIDNHVYLYYRNPGLLFCVMQAFDWSSLLQKRKFVFLMGIKNKTLYPLDFNKRYEINYQKMIKKPLRIEEMNRLCLWYKHPYAGSVFGCQVITENSNVIFYCGYSFHTNSLYKGIPLQAPWIQSLGNPNIRITWDMLNGYFNAPDITLKPDTLRQDIENMKELFSDVEDFSPADLFRAFFIVKLNDEKYNGRVTPVIFYDPHVWDISIYNDIIKSFRYLTVLTSFREPVMTFARCYENGLIWNEFQTKYILASEYAHTQFLDKIFHDRYYGFRFEDLKLEPKRMIKSLCILLNIPYEKKMLSVDAPMKAKTGETVRGFETTALNRNIDAVFSEFDKMRLKIFYAPIHKYYGYDYFDYIEYNLRDEDVEALFRYPFRFEKRYREKYINSDIDTTTMRQWLYTILVDGYKMGMAGKITFPKLIKPEEK